MSFTLASACIFGVLTLFLAAMLIIPKTKKMLFSFLDHLESKRHTPIAKPKETIAKEAGKISSKKAHNSSRALELIQVLNERQPTKKEEIKEIFTEIFGGKVLPTIRQDYDSPDTSAWLIQFNLPERGGGNIKIVQTTKEKIWKQKSKEF